LSSAPGATLLYAPNVHTGGGLVLLEGLLRCWGGNAPRVAWLDRRAQALLPVPAGVEVHWVSATVASRWAGERALQRRARHGDTLLCLNGLPPLLKSAARVVVFQQNRHLLGLTPLSDFKPRTAVRLGFERAVARHGRRRVDEYIVQTPSMARLVAAWYGGSGPRALRVLPFAEDVAAGAPPANKAEAETEWDFVYVSDGEAHKNHRRLLEAWRLLAAQGLKPRLALTLSARDGALATEVAAARQREGLEVHDLGPMSRAQVLALYRRSRALIFPSLSESFGLPLVEASQLGLPILAPELDYVRDVCTPAQTFDALSPVSIARAVRRFLGQPEPPIELAAPSALWDALASPAAPA